MSHYAKIENNIVTNIIVAEDDFIQSLEGEWVKTSYNTSAGVHKLGDTQLRKNFAGIGMIYDRNRDAFYSVKPYPSWILNEDKCIWESAIPYPEDGSYYEWSEEELNWKLL